MEAASSIDGMVVVEVLAVAARNGQPQTMPLQQFKKAIQDEQRSTVPEIHNAVKRHSIDLEGLLGFAGLIKGTDDRLISVQFHRKLLQIYPHTLTAFSVVH